MNIWIKGLAEKVKKIQIMAFGRFISRIIIRFTGGMAETGIRYIPDALLENPGILEKKYSILHGTDDYAKQAERCRRQTAQKYMVVFLLMLMLSAVSVASCLIRSGLPPELERPDYGQAAKTVPVEVQVKSGKVKTTIQTMLKISPVLLTEAEKQERLEACADSLPDRIKGSNSSIFHITEDIVLPDVLQDADSLAGISIVWESDWPEGIGKGGEIDNVGWLEKEAKDVTLTAKLSLEGAAIKRQYTVRILPNDKPERVKEVLKRRIQKEAEVAGKSAGSLALLLPETVGHGTEVEWKKMNKSYVFEIIAICLLVCLWIYKARYNKVDSEIRKKREAVLREFPEFADKLIMLLGAGLVVSAALSKIPEDYRRHRKNSAPNMLYEELLTISHKVKSTNASYIEELSKFAERLGIKELLRMTAIISENISKGSTLAEKLEAESAMLWQSRKKRAEEMGRLADTKLVLPLTLLLGTLIAVCAVPAWIGI